MDYKKARCVKQAVTLYTLHDEIFHHSSFLFSFDDYN